MKKFLLILTCLLGMVGLSKADTYVKVTDPSLLDEDQTVILAGGGYTIKAGEVNTAVTITISDNKIEDPQGVQTFTLKKSTNNSDYPWAFYTGSAYLCPKGNSNGISTNITLTQKCGAKYVPNGNEGHIIFDPTSSKNVLMQQGSFIRCYSYTSGYNNVDIYVLQTSTKPDPTASFPAASYDFDCGVAEIFYGPQVTTNSTGEVTYSITPASTASINTTGTEVTIYETGVYTVTASIKGTDDYNSAEVSYTINATSSLKGGIITKTFNFNENDYGMTHDTGNNYSNVGETFNLDNVVKLTVGENCRYFVSQGVTTFRIGKNQSSTLSVPEGTEITNVTIDPKSDNITISGLNTNEVTISNSSNAHAINSITVTYTDGQPMTQTLTVGTSGISTFCTKNALDFSEITNITAYVAVSADETSVTIAKVEGTVAGNTGLILMGEAGATADVPVVETGTAPTSNLLKTAFKGYTIEVSTAAFSRYIFGKLNSETTSAFHLLTPQAGNKVSTGNHAYLEVGESVFNAPVRRSIVIEGTDAIETISVDANTIDNATIYNVNGQSVSSDYKGFIIINGKKQLNK